MTRTDPIAKAYTEAAKYPGNTKVKYVLNPQEADSKKPIFTYINENRVKEDGSIDSLFDLTSSIPGPVDLGNIGNSGTLDLNSGNLSKAQWYGAIAKNLNDIVSDFITESGIYTLNLELFVENSQKVQVQTCTDCNLRIYYKTEGIVVGCTTCPGTCC